MKVTVTIDIEGGSTWSGVVEGPSPQCIEAYNAVANHFMLLGRAMAGGHQDVTIDPFKGDESQSYATDADSVESAPVTASVVD